MADYVFNPLLKKKLDLVGDSNNATVTIPQYNSDPASPIDEEVWVLKSGGGGSGGGEIKAFLGLSFPYLSTGGGGPTTYQLSYRTKEGTTVRTTLS